MLLLCNFPLFGLSSKAEGETVSVHLPHPFTHIPGAAGRKILSSLSTGPMAPLMLLCIVLLY